MLAHVYVYYWILMPLNKKSIDIIRIITIIVLFCVHYSNIDIDLTFNGRAGGFASNRYLFATRLQTFDTGLKVAAQTVW